MNKKSFWNQIREQIQAGDFPKVYITKAGKLALDGRGSELPADIAALFPAELRAAAEAKLTERIEADHLESEKALAKIAERKATRQAVIDKFGDKRVWRLSGLYIDDLSMDRYTYQEIIDWLSWDAYNLRHNHPQVSIVCDRGEDAGGDFGFDISDYFFNACNDKVRTPSFETLAMRLRDYVQMRRKNASQHN